MPISDEMVLAMYNKLPLYGNIPHKIEIDYFEKMTSYKHCQHWLC